MTYGGDKISVAKRREEELKWQRERDDRGVVVTERGENVRVGSLCLG